MNPPSTSYTFYAPVTASPPQMVALAPARRHHTSTAPQNGKPQGQQQIVSPQSTVRSHTQVLGRPVAVDPRMRYPSSQPPTPMLLDSPDPKRRRFNGNGVIVPAQGQIFNEQLYQYSPRGSSIQRPEAMQPRMAMAPPPRSVYTQTPPAQLHPAYPPPPQSKRDPGLTLPPLKTSTTDASKSQSQKSGIEAMIMSIPVLNKIKILSQISPHLAAPGIATPAHEVRGAIIAVEDMDPTSVFSMTKTLAEQLEKEGTFAVRIFGGPDPYESLIEGPQAMTTKTFLKVISEWHTISREMVQYITTRPRSQNEVEMGDWRASEHQSGSTPELTHSSQPNTRAQRQVSDAMDVDMPTFDGTVSTDVASAEPQSPKSAISPKTLTQTVDLSLSSPMPNVTNISTIASIMESPNIPTPIISRRPSVSTTTCTPVQPAPASTTISTPATPQTQPTPSPPYHRSAIPIAIVPHYQLTTVDASSIAMPITDAYSPLSHWQWLATLWRGCVGPDVTIVIQRPESDAESLNGAEKEYIPPQVEVRLLEWRSIIVRQGTAVGLDTDHDGWEKAKRRVGFEVEEFLRK
jgi:HMG box factor, other